MGQRHYFSDGVPHDFFIYRPIMPKLHQQVSIDTSLDQDKENLRSRSKVKVKLAKTRSFIPRCSPSGAQTCARIPTTVFVDSSSWPKLGRYIVYFCCSLWRLYPLFTSDSILSFMKSKFREKWPRSWRSCRTLDPRSEWVFQDFHGVQIISGKKSPVI